MGARLLVRAYRYTTMATLREPMNPAEREAFTNELTALLVNYLVAPRPWEEED